MASLFHDHHRFLANISKKVFGFDIQDVAIENTKKLLKKNKKLKN